MLINNMVTREISGDIGGLLYNNYCYIVVGSRLLCLDYIKGIWKSIAVIPDQFNLGNSIRLDVLRENIAIFSDNGSLLWLVSCKDHCVRQIKCDETSKKYRLKFLVECDDYAIVLSTKDSDAAIISSDMQYSVFRNWEHELTSRFDSEGLKIEWLKYKDSFICDDMLYQVVKTDKCDIICVFDKKTMHIGKIIPLVARGDIHGIAFKDGFFYVHSILNNNSKILKISEKNEVFSEWQLQSTVKERIFIDINNNEVGLFGKSGKCWIISTVTGEIKLTFDIENATVACYRSFSKDGKVLFWGNGEIYIHNPFSGENIKYRVPKNSLEAFIYGI